MAPDTDVVVVGGGATGVGVARDLALRGADAGGLDVALLERGGLSAGTSGRSHGLLHSGARYADDDPEGAVACRRENRIFREIAGECVAETGGRFVQLPGDDGDYFAAKLAACRECDIPVEAEDGTTSRETVTGLTPAVERSFTVPDAVVYPSRLVAATAADAQAHGARIETDATVTDVTVEDGATTGVRVRYGSGTSEHLTARHVVNAAGPWAGRVAEWAGASVPMAPTRGAMVVVESDLETVLNRCRPAADGDIVVPHPGAGTAVLGTTSVPVEDPDDYPTDEREVARIVEECGAMLAASVAPLRTYRGVRPLFSPEEAGRDRRAISRGFHVLDHAANGVEGFTTVVGGKLTTHRLMAEAVADRVCPALGVEADCRTADRPLPDADDPDRLDALVETYSARSPADEDVVGERSGGT